MKILILIFSLCCTASAWCATFDYSSITPHPRLLLREGEEQTLQKHLRGNPDMQKVHERILADCSTFLLEPPVQRIKEGKRLLAVSRTALKRIFYLSYAYRMVGDRRYAQRAEQEMLAASQFIDWNPSHFLDVGEMTMALAIGYDWLYDQLSPATRETVRQAIIDKGFAPTSNSRQAWFYSSATNWNQVCNGGLVYGALAIYEDCPETAQSIIERCMKTNPIALASYAPQGGYPEGYGYWGYGTSFQVMLLAALESAFGHDGGLSTAPGFLESAEFMQMMSAPSGNCFNFSDAEPIADCHMMLFWFARKTGNTAVLWPEIYKMRNGAAFAEDRLLPCLLIFGAQYRLDQLPAPSRHFWYNEGKTPVYIYREGWSSPNDTYLGIKGGSAATSHAHMDAGSFIFEAEGVRWAMDLGVQEYYTLESKGVDLWNSGQEGERWEVFRIGPFSHNTITANGHRHFVKGFAPIMKTFRTRSCKGAEVDLTQVLHPDLDSAVRKVFVDKKKHLIVTDRLEAGDSITHVRWSITTPACAKIVNDKEILLESQGRHRLLAVDCGAKDFALKIWSNEPPHAYDMPNPNTCRIGFEVTLQPGEYAELTTRLLPLTDRKFETMQQSMVTNN